MRRYITKLVSVVKDGFITNWNTNRHHGFTNERSITEIVGVAGDRRSSQFWETHSRYHRNLIRDNIRQSSEVNARQWPGVTDSTSNWLTTVDDS